VVKKDLVVWLGLPKNFFSAFFTFSAVKNLGGVVG
jgi:hypothetical protein